MREHLSILNFGGIKNVDFELTKTNIFIGPQASGKSITAKLFFYFKSFFNEIFKSVEAGESKKQFDRKQIERFINYFPKDTWPNKTIELYYELGDNWISMSKPSDKAFKLQYSEGIRRTILRCRKIIESENKKLESDPGFRFSTYSNSKSKYINYVKTEIAEYAPLTQLFVPAGRSFYANVQSGIFSFLSDNKSIDPFLIEFGSFYESYKHFIDSNFRRRKNGKKNKMSFDGLMDEVLSGRYLRDNEKDYLIHSDKRKVNLSYASSGQQETLPLLIILKALSQISFSTGGATLYIEEPEAHLFPTAQKRIVQLLARIVNDADNHFQLIVTTHSPYILAAFNNLIQGGKLAMHASDIDKRKLNAIIPEEERLDPGKVLGYSLKDGKKRTILDRSTKLISPDILDNVSDEIAKEFGLLLDLEFSSK